MLKRKITQILEEWKAEKNKPCLLVGGARQVGKTYIIDNFARTHYKNYIYINFELMPEYKSIFDGNLDFNTLRLNLEAYFPTVPLERGNTILFLDEIQSCPKARTALKSFAIDGTIDVVASGSLLGLYYKEVSSLPVGYEREIELYPLDFEEFLWANGINEDLITNLRKNFLEKTALADGLLTKFNEYFRLYMIIGGMPNVINDFLENHSLQRVRLRQKEIIDSYRKDVLKYASLPDKQKITKTFESIPIQLAHKNKKFVFSEIDIADSNASERKYSSAVYWLKDAGIINFCYNLQEPALPLEANKNLNSFKIYMRDTGLLMSMLDVNIQKAILDNNLDVNEGGVVENICAEEITTRYESPTYFERRGKLEIDFILDIDGRATAIEIKSGNDNQSKSLSSIIKNYKTVTRYIKFEKNTNIYTDDNNIEHYPLFMIMFI